jgi:hypothetical protein
MLLAPLPRTGSSFGLPQDPAFTWSSPEAPQVFAPPPASAAPRPLPPLEVTLLAPLPPAGLEALPPAEPAGAATLLAPLPPPAPPPALIPEPPPSLPPEASTPDLPVTLPVPEDWALALEPPFKLITPPGPAPLAEDPIALLDALWAARPQLPEIPLPGLIPPGVVPPAPPPPLLAWPML